MSKKRKILSGVLVLIAALLLLMLGGLIAYLSWEKPPVRPEGADTELVKEQTPEPEPESTPKPTPTPEPMPEGTAFENSRQDGIYTVLLVGLDQMSGSTDTILVGRFDTVRHEINFVSIPRDTIINVDSDVRKINSVYAGSINWGGNGIDSLMTQIDWLTGFVPDCYAVLDLNTFIDVIDELGGVDFDVPEEMEYYYDDIEERLYVYLAPGMQHLDGIHAMALCRYRIGYITGDYGRIDVQHEFLKACADQFIRIGNIPHARAVAEILGEHLKTNLSTANIAWFMRQLMKCKSEDIHFYTLPSEGRLLQGYSYAVPYLREWLDMVNTCLNPFDTPIEMWNMNLVYYDGSNYAGTQGYLDGAWYFEGSEDDTNFGSNLQTEPQKQDQVPVQTPVATPAQPEPQAEETATVQTEAPVPDMPSAPEVPPAPEEPPVPEAPPAPQEPQGASESGGEIQESGQA